MTTPLDAELFADGFCFGEGPRWRTGHLWLSDMHDHKVVRLDDSGVAQTIVEVPNRPSGLGWLPGGDLLVVSTNQEHGIIGRRGGGGVDAAAYPVGTLLRILPNHACATAAQHDRYHVVAGDTQIAAIWPRFSGW